MKRIVLILIQFSICICCSTNSSHNFEYNYVNASVLNIRNKPDLKSKIITGIEKGSIVKVLQKTKEYDTIEGMKSYWYKIQTVNGFMGYASSKYLQKFDNNKSANYNIITFKEKLNTRNNDIISYRSIKKYKNGDAGYCWQEEATLRFNFRNKNFTIGYKYNAYLDISIKDILYKNGQYYIITDHKVGKNDTYLRLKIFSNGRKISLSNFQVNDFNGIYNLGEPKIYNIPCSKNK